MNAKWEKPSTDQAQSATDTCVCSANKTTESLYKICKHSYKFMHRIQTFLFKSKDDEKE